MSWVYYQQTGDIGHGGYFLGKGYSGYGGLCNNSDFEFASNRGPIPKGRYRIGHPEHHPKLGRYSLRLTPVRMFKIISVFVASILVFATLTNAEELNACHILREIKRNGPRSVIDRFYGGSLKKSEPLENSISTGKTEWLEVVKLLRPATDAVESELLDYSVSMALPKNPLGVMTLLKSDPKNFTPDWICRDPYYEDTVDLATEKKFLQEAEKALVHMYDPKQDKAIDALRWQCLEGIRRDLRAVEKDLDTTGVKEMPITVPPSGMPPFSYP